MTEVAPVGPMLYRQLLGEMLRLTRNPAFSITSMVLPVMFYAFFGLPNAAAEVYGVSGSRYLLASFAAYAVLSVALFSFGATVAFERAQKMTLLMRATPLKPAVYLMAKIIASLAFAVLTLIVLFMFAVLAAGVHLAAAAWLALTFRLIVGCVPFIALGFAIGYITSPNAAIAIINLIYLPLSFASGLFVPVSQLPHFVQKIAPFLPTYHYAQLAWSAVGAASEPALTSVLWLAAYSVAFALIALNAYWREEKVNFS